MFFRGNMSYDWQVSTGWMDGLELNTRQVTSGTNVQQDVWGSMASCDETTLPFELNAVISKISGKWNWNYFLCMQGHLISANTTLSFDSVWISYSISTIMSYINTLKCQQFNPIQWRD